jgi:hypothetical protein
MKFHKQEFNTIGNFVVSFAFKVLSINFFILKNYKKIELTFEAPSNLDTFLALCDRSYLFTG